MIKSGGFSDVFRLSIFILSFLSEKYNPHRPLKLSAEYFIMEENGRKKSEKVKKLCQPHRKGKKS